MRDGVSQKTRHNEQTQTEPETINTHAQSRTVSLDQWYRGAGTVNVN